MPICLNIYFHESWHAPRGAISPSVQPYDAGITIAAPALIAIIRERATA
jgi:hypothetical protein